MDKPLMVLEVVRELTVVNSDSGLTFYCGELSDGTVYTSLYRAGAGREAHVFAPAGEVPMFLGTKSLLPG